MAVVLLLLFVMALSIFPFSNSVKDDGDVVTIQPMFWYWFGLWLICSATICLSLFLDWKV